MSKANYIVFIGALLLTGCATTNVAPLDDAYYWPDKSTSSAPSPSSPASASSSSSAPSSSIVYTSVQDTAVTIRIKR